MLFDHRFGLIEDFQRYWQTGSAAIGSLSLRRLALQASEPLPPRVTSVRLPECAEELGVDGAILAQEHLVPAGGAWAYQENNVGI